jgi:hypothetical protein
VIASILPETTVTFTARTVAAGGPLTTGVKVTATLAGEMLPLGKPRPVTLTSDSPASPEPGVVVAFSVTGVIAARAHELDIAAIRTTVREIRNLSIST